MTLNNRFSLVFHFHIFHTAFQVNDDHPPHFSDSLKIKEGVIQNVLSLSPDLRHVEEGWTNTEYTYHCPNSFLQRPFLKVT